MKIKRVMAAVLSAVTTFTAVPLAVSAVNDLRSDEFNVYQSIIDFVAENYIDPSYTSNDVMVQGLSELLEHNEPLLIELLKATLEGMDDYSEFYTAEEFKRFQEQVNKTFYGIGVTVKQTDEGYVEVTGFPADNDNAKKAGFEVGDKIIAVNGDNVIGFGLQAVCDRLMGEEGTTVSVTVLRGSSEIELTAPRVAVNENTVGSAILKGNIGYIQITTFSFKTADEFAKQLDIMRDRGVKKIILDLRNNGGGIVTAATNIAKMIVPAGKIVDIKYRQPVYNQTYTSDLQKKEFDFAVLVNKNTASSSEILASAIQDSGAGKIVGETTYGKAVVQNTYTMPNAAIKLTVGKYITRKGKEINNIGIKPDVAVSDTISHINMSKYTSFDFTTRNSLGDKGNNVKSAKQKLGLLGLYDGDTESNLFDDELKDALRKFQRNNDILAYGVLDVVTQETIDGAISKIEISDDKQFKTAYTLLGGKLEDLNE